MSYSMKIDLDKIIGIDVHVHAGISTRPQPETGEDRMSAGAAMRKHFKTDIEPQTLDQTAEYYRERKLACCIFGVDLASTGGRGVGTEEVLEAAERHSDVLIPFAWVDPRRGADAVADAKRFIDAGIQGFKFHPPAGSYFPNEERFFPLYEVIAAAGRPALFHTGQAGSGAGVKGGGGIMLKYGNPIYLDDIGALFPDMPIIMAHPSFPWQNEALAIAVHKPQMYIDLSGWLPKYFPPELVHYSNTLLRNKVLFGSDHALISPDRWMDSFKEAPFRDEVRPLIMKENAAKLFGLSK